ncbi:MAG: hypothetical protein H0U63_07285 [Burkholderiales bacterium]|nr:hypothetical protein [Burkholderiales bacterium]
MINPWDELNFACNAVNIGGKVILSQASPALVERLKGVGFEMIESDLSEFMKAGESARCLTLRLNEPRLK